MACLSFLVIPSVSSVFSFERFFLAFILNAIISTSRAETKYKNKKYREGFKLVNVYILC